MGLTYQKCPTCGGKGTIGKKPCPRCDGMGRIRAPMPAPKKGSRLLRSALLGKLMPMSPTKGPPLPSGANIHWPGVPERLKKGVTLVPEVGVPTPFGSFRLPRYGIPPIRKPRLTKERSAALRHAVGSDLSQVVAIIPVLGDTVADALEDLHMAEVRKILPPEEYDRFLQETKVAPDTIALLRTYMEKG